MGTPSWNRQRLDELVAEEAEARAGAPEAVRAVLAFARWKGLTEEPGIDRERAKADLDRCLNVLDDTPQSWGAMKELVGRWNDGVLKDMLRYSVERTKERLWGPELDRVPWLDQPHQAPAVETPKATTAKKGRSWLKRDRSR